jgi:putative endonuclease
MFYTSVLRCADGDLYVGSTVDLRERVAQHNAARVPATAHRLPVTLEYYEACRCEAKARLREKQLKTGFGRAYLKRRLDLEVAPRPQRFA